MKAAGSAVLLLGAVVAAVGYSGDDPPLQDEKPTALRKRGFFTVGKATTYVDGPLDADGHIDYAAALNERLRRGVTPENNANALLWKAIGPDPDSRKVSPEYFKLLGIPAPPATGNYFVRLEDYLRKERKLDPARIEDLKARVTGLRERPWTAKDQPEYHAWLNANEKPLAVVIEAVKRPKYYAPLVPNREASGQKGLYGALISGAQPCREFAYALCARAMRAIGENNPDAAWQDLLALHRLGRLVGRGGTLIEGLVGIAIDQIACRVDLAFLDRFKPDAKRLATCLRDLQSLPPLPDMAEKVDLGERHCLLDTVMTLDTYGFRAFDAKPDTVNEVITELMLFAIDWDPVLTAMNEWVDRCVANMRLSDRSKRADDYRQLFDDLSAMRLQSGAERAKQLLDDVSAGTSIATAKGRALAAILVPLLLPAFDKVQTAVERGQQTQDVVLVAFALAQHQREHGRYPERLDALAPKYLKHVPPDLFSGRGLVYRPAANGYLLYSIGPDGKDDGGRSQADDPAGDDIAVRMPLHQD
jgi:hypothetical protein